ncbi:hypothetical protein B7495_12625 [Cryobacterium sp. LW097]|uniref:hypothetical protein n=1 Tax=Cryobacterium sp. LW097 TaxID=1978566 RepID=UPI000B4D976C|nr:hypothetical protein [Cryobacterium sp. LW097]ASD22828.1 hypothetical protein B7495_12625 [Cryobacterium sp. LW097]
MWDTMNATRERVAELHEEYLRTLEPAQARLRARLVGPDEPDPDGTVGSLTAVTRCFLTQILEPRCDEPADLPSWWNPARPTAIASHPDAGPFTTAQLALIDEMQAYVAEVMTNSRPDVKWVIFKGHKKDFRNGQPMLQTGKGMPFGISGIVYGMALDVAYYHREVRPDRLTELVRDAIAK